MTNQADVIRLDVRDQDGLIIVAEELYDLLVEAQLVLSLLYSQEHFTKADIEWAHRAVKAQAKTEEAP